MRRLEFSPFSPRRPPWWAAGGRRWALGVGRWALGVGRWALGVGRNAECGMRNTGDDLGGGGGGLGAMACGENRTPETGVGTVVHFLTLTVENRTLVPPFPRERAISYRCGAESHIGSAGGRRSCTFPGREGLGARRQPRHRLVADYVVAGPVMIASGRPRSPSMGIRFPSTSREDHPRRVASSPR
jgi:hypothetical protein